MRGICCTGSGIVNWRSIESLLLIRWIASFVFVGAKIPRDKTVKMLSFVNLCSTSQMCYNIYFFKQSTVCFNSVFAYLGWLPYQFLSWIHTFPKKISTVKPHPGFELESSGPFLTILNVMSRSPPLGRRYSVSYNQSQSPWRFGTHIQSSTIAVVCCTWANVYVPLHRLHGKSFIVQWPSWNSVSLCTYKICLFTNKIYLFT